jgi:hypothetical protein
MAITAEFIGVYIAGIIITTATITVIGATITAITAIGETSGSSRQQTSSARVAAHAAAFCLFRPLPRLAPSELGAAIERAEEIGFSSAEAERSAR